jgi:hypothetical protein
MRPTTLATLLALAAAVTLPARADAPADDFLKADGWSGLKEYWTVKDGTVTGNSGEKGINFNTFLISKKTYKDFEMSFRVRLRNGTGNSGIQFRSKVLNPEKSVVGGPQADIGAGYWGSLYGEQFGGMMKEAPKDKVNEKLNPKDFNDYAIKCVGKHVTITVNGVVAVDQDFEKLPDEGIIAFQLHGGPSMEVTFTDIKFKELK